MTIEEKLQCIKNMGINFIEDCPSEHGLKDIVKNCFLLDPGFQCPKCWIKALED